MRVGRPPGICRASASLNHDRTLKFPAPGVFNKHTVTYGMLAETERDASACIRYRVRRTEDFGLPELPPELVEQSVTMIRVVVAEDAQLVRELLAHHVAREPDIHVAGLARNGREAVDLAESVHPDVILMDLEMPVLNGIQATERILARHCYIRILLLTAHHDLAAIGRLAGAYECLNKDCAPSEIVAAIRRVHGLRKTIATVPGASVIDEYSIERVAVRAGLTDRESRTLQYMMDTDLTMAQVSRALSAAYDRPVTVSAVKHTVERITNKLHVETRTRAALVKHVLEYGREGTQS